MAIVDDRTRLDQNLGDLTDVIDANLGKRPVYVIRNDPDEIAMLAARYDLQYIDGFDASMLTRVVAGRRRRDGRTAADPAEDATRTSPAPPPRRASPGCRTSFRPTTRRPTSRGSSPRRSRRSRRLPTTSRSSPSTTARTDRTASIADALAAAHPDLVRVVHHPVNQGYGAALRSGFAAARYDLIAFTDGDRQFQIADIGRLTARLAEADDPDVVVGFRIRRADPPLRIVYARAYRLANRIFFGLHVTDVDCACKLFKRAALEGLAVESGGAFFSAELLIKLRAAGRTVVEVGVPHYPRTAGSPTGAKPQVIARAVRDFWRLRLRMWVNRRRALRRGTRILGTPS